MTLKEAALSIRENTLRCISSIGVGHIGGCLSIADILAVLYFKHMNVDSSNPKKENRDRLVVSKGHAGPAVYATLALKGYFPIEMLDTLNQSGTNLPSHCDMRKTPGIDMTAGSLGQGLSCAVGIALASRLANDGAYTYAIIGDGESQEGQIWEAAMYAGNQKLNRLIVFTDYNDLQIDGKVSEVNGLEPLKDKWESFNFNTIVVDGHNLDELDNAIISAKKQDKPTMIIAKTTKGKGVSFIEEKGAGNHNAPFSKEDYEQAIEELRRNV